MSRVVLSRDAAAVLLGRLENLFKCEEESDFPIESVEISTPAPSGSETPQSEAEVQPNLSAFGISVGD